MAAPRRHLDALVWLLLAATTATPVGVTPESTESRSECATAGSDPDTCAMPTGTAEAPARRSSRDPAQQYCEVARRAGAQVHRMYCEECQKRQRLTPFVPKDSAEIRSRLRARRENSTRERPRTAWFMTIVKPWGPDTVKMARYQDFMRAAVVSGLLNAPSLAPYVLYAYNEGQEFGEVDSFYAWLASAGVRVVPHQLSFRDRLSDQAVKQEANLNVGCWVRLDIAQVVANELHDEFVRLGIRTDYVLYTDADVMLAGDFPTHDELRYCSGCQKYPESSCCRKRLKPGYPRWFLATSDADILPFQMNSGVMYLNVRSMAEETPKLVEYAAKGNWDFPNKDNGLLAYYFTKGHPTTDSKDKLWDQFDDAVFNSRAYMQSAGPKTKIWHWHGFKPGDVKCWLKELLAGRMSSFVFNCSDKSVVHKMVNDLLKKDSCLYLLHMQLLGQYEQLLDIADQIESYLA